MTETYLKTLARHLLRGNRVSALRLCNRVLKKSSTLRGFMISGKRRFWEQIQFELKKPDPDFAQWEFVRLIRNPKISEHDFDTIQHTYKTKADVLSWSYYDAYYHFRIMELVKELKKEAVKQK